VALLCCRRLGTDLTHGVWAVPSAEC
jgi:hypothetical protein